MSALFDVFRAYPGGMAQLSRDSDVPLHTLYRVANGEHRRQPSGTIDQIAAAFRGKTVLGSKYDAHVLVKLWEARPKDRVAS